MNATKYLSILALAIVSSVPLAAQTRSSAIHTRGMLHETLFNTGEIGRSYTQGNAGNATAVPLMEWPGRSKVTIDQVPAAVKATILKEAGDHKITEIEKETKDGKTIYEAEWVADGKEIEIKVAEDGTLLGKETEDADDDKGGDKDKE